MCVPKNLNIVIAGASGYIGQALIPQLLTQYPNCKLYALSRSIVKHTDPRIMGTACDLFSLKSLEQALPPQVDLAIYLVHSMGPTAALDQGSFADYDLILADNFARALKKRNLQQLIYLGGLIPQQQSLSLHLKSRLEVEDTFKQHHLPLTVFRAGLIMGKGGSSFQMMLKLVQRLPMMICPSWTQTLTSPVDLPTVLNSIVSSSLQAQHIGKTYDLAGCPPLSYLEMMKITAERMGKKKLFIRFPYLTPTLSRLWVSLITQSPRNLVYPLIESLKHPMLARASHQYTKPVQQNYHELLNDKDLSIEKSSSLFRFQPQRKTVRSVQRLPLPQGKNAAWVKEQYLTWLPHFLSPWIHIEQSNQHIAFYFKPFNLMLLDLKLSTERSHKDRQLLYIQSGFLVSKKNKGRLEFRSVLDGHYILAAIHDYTPSLPWFIYIFTQAKAHAWVMKAFCKYLQNIPFHKSPKA